MPLIAESGKSNTEKIELALFNGSFEMHKYNATAKDMPVNTIMDIS